MSEEILTAAAGTGETSPALRATSPEGEAKPARTLDMVTAEIKFLDAQAGRLVMGHALEIGRRLTEAKELVPYGEWGAYLEKQLNYSQSTANKLMKVFQEFGASQMGLFGPEVESETFTNLTYSKALALLSLPREERADFLCEVDAESMSTRELKEAIRERDEARKAAKVLQLEKEDLDKGLSQAKAESAKKSFEIQDLKKKIEEIESRPVGVAVQEPDPEEIEKRAQEIAAGEAEKFAAHEKQLKADAAAEKTALEEKLKKAQKTARAEREKLEAQLKEAEGKLAAAGEADKAEAEKLRAEAEALRKQLAMSSQEIVIFKLRFSAWQEAHKLMAEAFAALPDEETKEKMRAAIRAQVKAWGWAE